MKVRKSIAVWLRLKAALRKDPVVKGAFTADELKEAEKQGIRWLQRIEWQQEMNQVRAGQKASKLQKLGPQIQDNMLILPSRTGTELPIIPRGRFSELLAQEAHQRQGHQGRSATAADLRRSYWLIDANEIARKVTRNCLFCQRRRAKPADTRMADLPPCRLTPGPPFTTTGIDFFGPFLVRKHKSKSTSKAYGVIFTCAVSRAVHLEVAESLDTSSFVNALRRFIARRGNVRCIVSDNGTNFEGGESALAREAQQAIDAHRQDKALVQQLQERAIEWKYNPPAASHHGGFFERLIRSVRRIMGALLQPRGRSVLTTESMTTIMCECEAILNDRPLTEINEDPDDLEPLTPNHLLIGRSAQPLGPAMNFDALAPTLRHRWKHVQFFVSQFWSRWTKEYKTLLHTRTKWIHRTSRPFKIDDVVLIMDSGRSRQYWPLGRVVRVHPSQDGEVRVVDVKSPQGVYTKPITKLCMLEAVNGQ